MDKERRLHEGVEYRKADDGSSIVRGYGAVFGKRADIGGWFTEEIKRGAFDNVLDNQDVVFVFNHDEDRLLARST